MDNFKAVYKILSQLEHDMDIPEPDLRQIDHEALGVSELRWARYIEMMLSCGYIEDARVVRNMFGEVNYDCHRMKITLKGLEYLQENSAMQKVYKTLKGIKESVPML